MAKGSWGVVQLSAFKSESEGWCRFTAFPLLLECLCLCAAGYWWPQESRLFSLFPVPHRAQCSHSLVFYLGRNRLPSLFNSTWKPSVLLREQSPAGEGLHHNWENSSLPTKYTCYDTQESYPLKKKSSTFFVMCSNIFLKVAFRYIAGCTA